MSAYRVPGEPGVSIELPEEYDVIDERSHGVVYAPRPAHKCKPPSLNVNEDWGAGTRYRCFKCDQVHEIVKTWFSRKWVEICVK